MTSDVQFLIPPTQHQRDALEDVRTWAKAHGYSSEAAQDFQEYVSAERASCYDPKDTSLHPSTFFDTTNTPPHFIPRRADEPWRALGNVLAQSESQVCISLLPTLWQMGPLVFRTAREHKKTVSFLPSTNTPLAAEVLRQTDADFVVATPKSAALLRDALEDAGVPGKVTQWLLVVPVGSSEAVPPLPGSVVIEHQLYPGCALGKALPEQPEYFIPYEEYVYETSSANDVILTSTTREACPLLRVRIGTNATTKDVADGIAITCTRL